LETLSLVFFAAVRYPLQSENSSREDAEMTLEAVCKVPGFGVPIFFPAVYSGCF